MKSPDPAVPRSAHSTKLIAALRVPPHVIGRRVEPETREDAARERLAYIEAMWLDPYSVGDDDVELVVSAERLWAMGALDRDEAFAMLRPLQVAP
jgi:hypothetical protein